MVAKKKDKELGDQQVEEAILVTIKKHTLFPKFKGPTRAQPGLPSCQFLDGDR